MSYASVRDLSIPGSNRRLRANQPIERDRRRKHARRAKILLPRLVELEDRVMLSNWSGPITSITTWSNTEVLNVVGNVDVEPGVTLTVRSGTVVQFNARRDRHRHTG